MARAFQAIGAASLNPVSLAIIVAVFPYERRGAAIGIWGALSGVAAAAGPVLGGFLVQSFDWRWIFLVNLPFCVINLAQYANNAPPQFRAQARASLQALGDKITALFKQAVVQSFETTWLAAAFGAVVGFILAFVTLVFRRKGLNEQQSGETVEADVAIIR